MYDTHMSSTYPPPGARSPSADKSLKCEECGATFDTTQELAQHNRQVHKK